MCAKILLNMGERRPNTNTAAITKICHYSVNYDFGNVNTLLITCIIHPENARKHERGVFYEVRKNENNARYTRTKRG